MTEAEQLRAALADALQQIQEAASARLNVVIQMKNTIAELEKALASKQAAEQAAKESKVEKL